MAAPLAAAAPVPVVVNVGPTVDGSRFLQLSAAEPIVVATPFLSTKPVAAAGAAAANVELAEWQLLCAFGSKARAGSALLDQNALAGRNLLTLQLTAAFWGRYLVELVASGFLASPLTHRKALDTRIATLTARTAANLEVHVADWSACQAFDTPAIPGAPAVPAVAASRGRLARAGVAAIPATPAAPGPAELTFIALANLSLLEDLNGAAPWSQIARGAGMLSGASTRAIRSDGLSAVRCMATLLRSALARHVGVAPTPANDAALASSLRDFLRDTVLTDGLEAHGVSPTELMKEAKDSFRAD